MAKKKQKNEKSLRARAQKRLAANRNKIDPNERAKDFKGTLKRSLRLFEKEKFNLFLIFLGGIGSAIFSIFGPGRLGDMISELKNQVINKIGGGELNLHGTWMILLSIIIIYVVSCIATFIQQRSIAGVSQRIVYSLREKVNLKISRLPLSYFDKNSKGDVLSRVTNDMDNIARSLQNAVSNMILAVVTIAGVCIMMFITDFWLALITVLAFPVCSLIAALITKYSQRHFKGQWEQTGEINGHIEEMYTGHKLIKVFNRQKESIEEFDEINEDLRRSTQKAQAISGLIAPLNDAVNNFVFVLICVIGGILSIEGKIAIGDITAFLVYSKLFTYPIQTISTNLTLLQSALASLERVFKMLDEKEMEPEKVKTKLENVKGDVEFKNVSFRYVKDRPLIENLNLSVKAGQTVAIVGPTGAGKTTIVNLLMRFYEINGGKIFVDGVNIKDVSKEDLRNTFGMVLQDTWLFNGTIKENIAYGKQGCTDEEIYAAAKAARADHFIKTLSEGYDTVLDEEASNVSQGQRQLLTIARAILADPKILILDEATSSVDTRTEVQIQKAMVSLMENRTNFVIAHRLSTIRDADIILVMDKGKIVESGSHSELIEKKGFYYELYNAQFAGKNIDTL